MADQEPFQDWLEQFNRDWWRAPQEPASSSLGPASFRLDDPQPAQAPAELASRVERLAEERARLQQKADELARENLELKERQAGIETQLAEFNTSLSRARQAYEAKIAQLEAEKRSLDAQGKTLDEGRSLVQQSLKTLQDENKQLREDLRLQTDKKFEADRAALELKRRIQELEAAVTRLREERAAQLGAMAELRRQGDGYQQRLIHAKELTDSDVALLRQEMRLVLDELRNAAGRLKSGQETT